MMQLILNSEILIIDRSLDTEGPYAPFNIAKNLYSLLSPTQQSKFQGVKTKKSFYCMAPCAFRIPSSAESRPASPQVPFLTILP